MKSAGILLLAGLLFQQSQPVQQSDPATQQQQQQEQQRQQQLEEQRRQLELERQRQEGERVTQERLKELEALGMLHSSDKLPQKPPPLLEFVLAPVMERDATFDLKSIPFDQWLAANDRAQVPWKVQIQNPALRMDQRLEVAYTAKIQADTLNKYGSIHDLFFISAVGSPGGKCCLVAPKVVHYTRKEKLAHEFELRFSDAVLTQPGDYWLWLILYDRANAQHNIVKRRIHVPPIENDPLPDADKALPNVELPGRTDRERGTVLEFYRGLSLPIGNKQPLHRSVSFQQSDAGRLDWVGLTAAITKDYHTIDIASATKGDVSFFTGTLNQHLTNPSDASRVLIFISGSSVFESIGGFEPLALPGECRCRAYHLILRRNAGDGNDDLGRLLKPLHPRTFNIFVAQDFRKALAEIIKDLGEL